MTLMVDDFEDAIGINIHKIAHRRILKNLLITMAASTPAPPPLATMPMPAAPPAALMPPAHQETQASHRRNRHAAGFTAEKPTKKPLKDFIKDYTPSKPLGEYVLSDCKGGLDKIATKAQTPSVSPFLGRLVAEAQQISESKMDYLDDDLEGLRGQFDAVLAVVLYSFDLSSFSAPEGVNFYSAVNLMLQTRRQDLIEACQGFWHHFMRAMSLIKVMPACDFFRGLPADKVPIVQQHYREGRPIHSTAVTSVSEEEVMAKEDFAGPRGVVMTIKCRSARSIKDLSAFYDEAEALLMPNFKCIVIETLRWSPEENIWRIGLLEPEDSEYMF